MADVERVPDDRRLRIAVLADFDGPHARSWLRWFVERGHDVHAISFYAPAAPIDGVTSHALRDRLGAQRSLARGAPAGTPGGRARGVMRLAHAARYRRAGLRRVLVDIAPDVFHGHYVVEHGFYGAFAGVRPYVVTAWGSDVLVEPFRDPVSRWIAKWTLRHADLATSNNRYMAERMRALAGAGARVEVVTLGTDRAFLDRRDESVNLQPPDASRARVVLSTRAHEPLYNVEEIIEAYQRVARVRGDVRLVIAHGGSRTEELRRRAAHGPGRVEFIGFLDAEQLRRKMTAADIFVSMPSTDGTSVALLQAMAAGCFPIVSDLPTQRELVEDGASGLRVPPHRPEVLAEALRRALDDAGLRRRAAEANRVVVEERGLNEVEMRRMEELYLSLRR